MSALGAAGLQALDYIDKWQSSPDAWRTQQSVLVDQAQKPEAGLLVMVAMPVQQLLEASAVAGRN